MATACTPSLSQLVQERRSTSSWAMEIGALLRASTAQSLARLIQENTSTVSSSLNYAVCFLVLKKSARYRCFCEQLQRGRRHRATVVLVQHHVQRGLLCTAFYEAFVTGPLWGWPANSGFNQLLDDDGDGIYSVTIETPAGDIGCTWIRGSGKLIDDMQNGASCAPVTEQLQRGLQHHQR